MGKKVLVIGGSYFVGRVFAMIAAREAGFELTLLNRGHYSMSHLPNVREFHCDRHDGAGLRQLPPEEYDAVVDFCAYTPEDVRELLTALPGKPGRYILLSTADVYERDGDGPRDEYTDLLHRQPTGPAGEYMFGKVMAEQAALDVCELRQMPLTILRPAFVYGPYNYAPRESWFVQQIVKGLPVPVPTDGQAKFQFVYVKDVARAIIACINNEVSLGKAYNLAAPEVLDYPAYAEVLRKVSDIPFSTVNVTVQQVMEQGLPLPFPLFPEESELFAGHKICHELGLEYTPFEEGMSKAFQAFKSEFTEA